MRNYLKKFKRSLFRTQRTESKSTSTHTGSLCSDSLSAYYQVDYKTPEVIVDFLGNGKKFIDDKIRNMHPDSFNEPFLDRYIDSLIELAKDEINEQRASHERAILDIKMGQITKVHLYKNSIEKCKEEMEQLKLEEAKL